MRDTSDLPKDVCVYALENFQLFGYNTGELPPVKENEHVNNVTSSPRPPLPLPTKWIKTNNNHKKLVRYIPRGWGKQPPFPLLSVVRRR